jgi:hypothetical protein
MRVLNADSGHSTLKTRILQYMVNHASQRGEASIMQNQQELFEKGERGRGDNILLASMKGWISKLDLNLRLQN